jgi:hypothetical protein
MIVIKVQHANETQIIITNLNVVDVNVTTRRKVIETQVFKDEELRKANNVTNMEKEK